MPMRYSLAGTLTLTWPEVADAARTAERLGFDAFYATDHLMGVAGFAPELGVLDALSLALALGPVTERIRLGCIVSPVTMRHPVMLARALQTLDVITGGRAEIGLGAAWNAQEHEAFGFGFPAASERLAMLEEATRTIVALWDAEEPVSLDGRYPLRGALLLPRPVQRPAPVLIGGGSVKAERIARLRSLEARYGREGQVEVSVMLSLADPAAGPGALLERLAEIGVQRVVLSTPRPWHPDKLAALAAALPGLGALHRRVQAFGLVAGLVELGDGSGLPAAQVFVL
jgi:alkanesulfonate monooxygenase SsuD/methylene tetrahydromethanopterin reductase-like flavin-dependent oxidoreductase (luciferase family)